MIFARPSGFALAIVLAACHSVEGLEPPPLAGAQTRLYAFASAGEVRSIWIGPAEATPPAISAREAVDVYVLDYACPLAALGVDAGFQALAPEPAARAVFPFPGRVQRARIDAGLGAWSREAAVPLEVQLGLRRMPVQADHHCRLLGLDAPSVRTVSFRLPGYVDAAVPLGGGRSLIAIQSRTSSQPPQFFITDGDVFQPTTLETRAANGALARTPSGGGLVTADGRLWMFDGFGRVATGPPEGPLLEQPTIDGMRGRPIVSILGPRPGEPFELFLLASDRVVYYDGVGWLTLETRDDDSIVPLRGVRLGPGSALFTALREAGEGPVRVSVANGPSFSYDTLPERPIDRQDVEDIATGVGVLEGVGPMLGVSAVRFVNGRFDSILDGQVFRGGSDAIWERGLDSGLSCFITEFIPLDEGTLLYGGRVSFRDERWLLRVFHKDAGICSEVQLPEEMNWALPTAGGLLFTDQDPLYMNYLSRRPAEPCLLAKLE